MSNSVGLPPPTGSAHAAAGTPMPRSGSLNPAAWIPAWLRAAPNLAVVAMVQRRA
jgi:hypothetical protein